MPPKMDKFIIDIYGMVGEGIINSEEALVTLLKIAGERNLLGIIHKDLKYKWREDGGLDYSLS